MSKFGLKVSYDWHSHVTVELPTSYSSAVCGLCGNFNGNAQDDMTTKNGNMSYNVSSFVQSWRTTENQEGCQELEPTTCPQVIEKVQRQTLSECGIILKEDGPFRGCHDSVNPEKYFHKCLNDFCFYSGRQDVYCKVIEAYAAACQAVNGTVDVWRKNVFCSEYFSSTNLFYLFVYLSSRDWKLVELTRQ